MKNIQAIKTLKEFSEIFSLTIDKKLLNDSNSAIIYIVLFEWAIAIRWFINLTWDNRFKVCKNRHLKNHSKARGELLERYFLLCERCYTYQDYTKIKPPYDNAIMWFSKIIIELQRIEIDNIFYPPKVSPKTNNRKEAFLNLERNKSKILRASENPFSDTNTQALKILIDSALIIAEKSPNFKEDYWKEFLDKYSAYIKELQSPDRGTIYFKDNHVHVRCGRGRGGSRRLALGTTEDYMKKFRELLM